REKMSEDMRLRDFRARTQEAYLLAVRQFLDKVKSEPETLTDEDVRRYFLFLRGRLFRVLIAAQESYASCARSRPKSARSTNVAAKHLPFRQSRALPLATLAPKG